MNQPEFPDDLFAAYREETRPSVGETHRLRRALDRSVARAGRTERKPGRLPRWGGLALAGAVAAGAAILWAVEVPSPAGRPNRGPPVAERGTGAGPAEGSKRGEPRGGSEDAPVRPAPRRTRVARVKTLARTGAVRRDGVEAWLQSFRAELAGCGTGPSLTLTLRADRFGRVTRVDVGPNGGGGTAFGRCAKARARALRLPMDFGTVAGPADGERPAGTLRLAIDPP